MAPFPFREKRLESNLQVWVALQANSSQTMLPGRLEGTLINISKTGACLLIPKLLIEGKHLFFATLNSSCSLLLQRHETLDGFDDFTISARSVWMDSCQHMDRQQFKVGLCFSAPQQELFDTVKKRLHSQG